jgi:Domain of unknown function (DUF4082)
MRRLASLLLAVVLISPIPALAADHPVATLFSPTDGVSVPPNEPLLIFGGAFNGETGNITEVEVSTDDGASWSFVDAHTENWLFTVTPTEPGPLTIKARAHTSSVTGEITVSRTIHVGGTTTPPMSGDSTLYLNYGPTPRYRDPDDQAVELGIRTRVDRPGSFVGVFLWRGSYTGPVTARVWSADGILLAEQPAPGAQTAQRINFSTPVPVQADTEYVVSYYTPTGGYLSAVDYFTGNIAQTPFRIPVNAGVYRYGGGFPTETWNAGNYWVEPTFRP